MQRKLLFQILLLFTFFTSCTDSSVKEVYDIDSIFLYDNNSESIDLERGIILNLPFDQNANDLSGNNHIISVVGNLYNTIDRKGNPSAIYYSGTANNFIKINDNPLLNLNTFSINVWVYVLDGNYNGYILNKGRDINIGSYALTSKYMRAVNNTTTLNAADFSLTLNKWTMLTTTVSGKNIKVYIDGLLVKETLLTSEFTSNSVGEPLTIGNHYYNGIPNQWQYPFIGKLDDLRLYNRILNNNEIQTLLNL